jgi:hypothetical protein
MNQPSPSRLIASGSMNDSISAAESLDFLAFRYVVGELTAAETTAFEELLEADQAAREAVAAAVEITAAIQAAGVEPVIAGASVSVGGAASASQHGTFGLQGTASLCDTASLRGTVPRRRWRVIGSWLVGGSLACLGMVALVDHWAAQRLRDAGGELASGSSGDAASDSVPGQLARLWSETRPLAVGDLTGDSDDPTDMDGVGGLFAAGTGAGDGPIDAVADAPSWMIAAVAAKSGTVGDDSAEASMEPTAMPHSSPHVVPDAKPAAGAIP